MKGRSIRMAKLDGLVTDSLVERLLHPERLAIMLSSLRYGAPRKPMARTIVNNDPTTRSVGC